MEAELHEARKVAESVAHLPECRSNMSEWDKACFSAHEIAEVTACDCEREARIALAGMRNGLGGLDRETMADGYIRASGKARHNSDCATSMAPAFMPGPCDCDAPADLRLIGFGEAAR